MSELLAKRYLLRSKRGVARYSLLATRHSKRESVAIYTSRVTARVTGIRELRYAEAKMRAGIQLEHLTLSLNVKSLLSAVFLPSSVYMFMMGHK